MQKKILSLVLILFLIFNPVFVEGVFADASPSPTPDPTTQVSPTTAPSSAPATPDPNATVSPSPTDSASPLPSPSPTDSPSPSPSPSSLPTIAPTDSPIPTIDPSASPIDSATPSPSLSPDPNSVTTDSSVLQSPSPSPSASPDPVLSPSPSPSADPSGSSNSATAQNTANANANTGTNLSSNSLGNTQITTGQALAIANLLNLLNTGIVNSNFQVAFIDQTGSGTIDLNQLWNALMADPSTNSLMLANNLTLGNLSLVIQNQNQANLNNQVNVNANSGNNQANQNNNASVQTGNAGAVANVTNLVNTNVVGAQFFLGVINILGSQAGNLILPNPSNFTQTNGATPSATANQGQVNLTNNVGSGASTGQNSQVGNGGSNQLSTGNATANSNSISLANLNLVNNNWFFLLINNMGTWTGEIISWTLPGGQQAPQVGTQLFQLGSMSGSNLPNSLNGGSLVLPSQNIATVNNQIQTNANTGGNQANGNAGNTFIQTGNAVSLANLLNLVNLNIVGGHWFFGLVNVLGNWNGNVVFAYPELAININEDKGTVNPGDTVNYDITVTNQGYDNASSAGVNLNLPQGLSYLNDTSGISHSGSGQNISWQFGKLKSGQAINFNVQAKVDPNIKPGQSLSWISKLIPQAYASDGSQTTNLVVNTSVSTPDTQSSTSGNSASVTTMVVDPSSDSSASGQASLTISGGENVGSFVYAGDTVTYNLSIQNTGNGSSNNTVLNQQLFNSSGIQVGTVQINLGTINPGKTTKVSFGLNLTNGQVLTAGDYHTVSWAAGTSSDGSNASSNQLTNNFIIAAGNIGTPVIAQAAINNGKILGTKISKPYYKTINNDQILFYILILLLSSWYIISRVRKRFYEG